MKANAKSLIRPLLCALPAALFLGSLIYVAVGISRLGHTPVWRLMLLQSVLGIIAALLPLLLIGPFGWRIPNGMLALYETFLILSIFLGEIMLLYERVGFFDDLMHFISAALLATLGYSLIAAAKGLSRRQAALYILTFSLWVGVLWELFEFSADGILGLNMQRFLAEGGTPLMGRAALRDTMQDLAVDLAGGATVGAIYSICERLGMHPLSALRIEFGGKGKR